MTLRTFRRFCSSVAVRSTPLGKILAEKCQESGSISFAEYMAAAMCDPEHGYFTTSKRGKVIGGKGDFITAPELLPEFGWCFARWVQEAAAREGASELSLVELGPGTGKLMSHLLMYLKYEVGIESLSKIHLRMLEVSPVMIEQQREMLKPFSPHLASLDWGSDFPSVWGSLPPTPTFVTSNEYFDVLPVNIVSKRDGVWYEERVKVEVAGSVEKFYLERSEQPWEGAKEYIIPNGDEDVDRLEVCPQAIEAVTHIGSRIEAHGGMMLAVDYGKDIPSVNTLQGMSNQVTCSPLINPGQIDISWHVDFSSLRDHLRRSCPSLSLTSAHPQRDFLSKMGFDAMYQHRASQPNPPDHLEYRYKLLMDEGQMGGYHRAVGLCRKEVYPPPGF